MLVDILDSLTNEKLKVINEDEEEYNSFMRNLEDAEIYRDSFEGD